MTYQSCGTIVVLALLAGACTEPQPADIPPEKPVTTNPGTATGVTTPTGTSTGVTTTTTETNGTGLVYDCGLMPEWPSSINQIGGPARGYHDVAFTDDGKIVGQDTDDNLIKVDQFGNVEVFVGEGQLDTLEQFDREANGDLLVAKPSNASLSRITTAGAVSVVASGFATNGYALYGVTVGPYGNAWVADTNDIFKVDVTTGQKFGVLPGGYEPKVVNFNHDGSIMYFGTLTDGGKVWEVAMDTALMVPISPPILFADDVGSWHDGIGVDACGNVYLADYTTDALYRMTPTGRVQIISDPNGTDYGHGLRWGNGIDGWRDDAIYQPQPYNSNKVVEVVVEVPDRTFQGTVIGTPTFW
jgi:hypothetical protein